MARKNIVSCMLIAVVMAVGCNTNTDKKLEAGTLQSSWKQQFNNTLPMLGHRNWILIVDQAFPQQNAVGIEYINSGENLLPVLQYVMEAVNKSSHVKPIIYQDKELSFITEEQAKGVTQFAEASKKILGIQQVQSLLHDSIFTKLDTESKLFKVLVIKTNETIPYTSVFLLLDCAYWTSEKERQLRATMAK